MITVRVPGAWTSLTGGKAELRLQAGSVREAVDALERAYPGIRARVLGEEGALRRSVRLFLNDHGLSADAALETPLGPRDRLHIVTALAGG